jgi:hypothetical protein
MTVEAMYLQNTERFTIWNRGSKKNTNFAASVVASLFLYDIFGPFENTRQHTSQVSRFLFSIT